MNSRSKLLIVAIVTGCTLAFHYYDILFAGMVGHSHLMHAIHGRLCYIPIVLSAFWFGIRGGIVTALVISYFSLLYIYIRPVAEPDELFGELTEIAFYFAIGGFSGILLDSERSSRRKKEEAEQKLAQAEKLSLVGQMVTSIAHEIKNPLGSIKGAVQILNDGNTPEKDKAEFITIMEREIDRLDNVVRDYLSFAKPTPSQKTDVNLCDIFAAVIRQMKYQCEQNKITIELKSIENATIMGDPNRLRQLFLNIILNAVQAMPGGGEISIQCGPSGDVVGNWVRVIISDTGVGIPKEDLRRVFEPFFTTSAQGTGLGLATARAIVDEHDGKIDVESAEGKGATFIIDFPPARVKS
jgi:signal transduction histidine kinase